jgi:hypothetical protein
MKYFFTIVSLFLVNLLHAQQAPSITDPSLNRIIVSDILMKTGANQRIIVTTPNLAGRGNHINSLRPPQFLQLIRCVFYLSEPWIIKKLVDHSYQLNPEAVAGLPVRFVKTETIKDPAWATKELISSKVINELIILWDQNRGKCLVYFHIIQSGMYVASLEKVKNDWKVKQIITEFVE